MGFLSIPLILGKNLKDPIDFGFGFLSIPLSSDGILEDPIDFALDS